MKNEKKDISYSCELLTFLTFSNLLFPLALSKDANWVITGSDDCTLKLWNLELCQVTQIFYDHTKPITCVALADDNSFAVSGRSYHSGQ